MRNLFVLLLIAVMALQAEEAGVFLFGNPLADLSIYLNTSAAEKKLDPQLYAQMMAKVKKARRSSLIETDLPIDFSGRDWEVVANLRFLKGKLTFLVDGVVQATGGLQKEIESLSRVFEGTWQISEVELEGMKAKRFALSSKKNETETENSVKDKDAKNDDKQEEEEDDDTDTESDDLQILDVLLASLSDERFQFTGACNTSLDLESTTWTKNLEENIFLHDDLILAVYFNIPRLLPLLPDSSNNPRAAILKDFLEKLTHVVVSFQPDGMDLVLHIRLVFKTEELALAMKPSIDQTVKALAQALTMLGGFQEPTCGVRGKICDISGKINIKTASANLEKMMH